MATRAVIVYQVLEVVDVEPGHWCHRCLLPSAAVVTLASQIGAGPLRLSNGAALPGRARLAEDDGAVMAVARIQFQWPDGDELVCEIEVSESYPDAVAEAKSQALSMYATALGVTLATSTEDKDSD